MTELLPCPFCGGEAEIESISDQMGHLTLIGYIVKCSECWCAPKPNNYEGNIENAIKRWNTRAAVTDEQFAFAVHDGDALQNVRTCHNTDSVPGDGSGFYPTPHFKCSACGASYALTGYACYCPGCGAKVV